MNLERIVQMIVLAVKKIQDPYYHGFAAQMAFYFLMSIVPTIILFTRILEMDILEKFSLPLNMVTDFLEEYMAKDVAEMVMGMLEVQSSGSLNLVFLIIVLVASSRGVFALMRIANYTLTDGKSTGKGYWRDRIRAMTTVPQTLLTIVFGLITLVYGELIIKLVLASLLAVFNIDYEVNAFWMMLRWPVTMLLYFLMVAYNYYILPSVRVTFKSVVPGSIFASVGMLVVTVGYKMYAESVSNYDIIYGSLASVVAVMMWFYFISWALVLGIMCNAVWGETEHLARRNKKES